MGYMKAENIRELNEEPRFTTPDLEAWVIMATNMLGGQTYDKSDEYVAKEIISSLRERDELQTRVKFLEMKYEALYTRLQKFINKMLDSPGK